MSHLWAEKDYESKNESKTLLATFKTYDNSFWFELSGFFGQDGQGFKNYKFYAWESKTQTDGVFSVNRSQRCEKLECVYHVSSFYCE